MHAVLKICRRCIFYCLFSNRYCIFLLQLDAKNSPLALLVQTCSSIGRDPQANKSVGTDKKDSAVPAANSHSTKEATVRLKSTPPSEKASKGEERRKSSASYHNVSDSHNKKEQTSTSRSNSTTTKTSPNKSCFRAPNAERALGIHDKYSNGLFNGYDKFSTPGDENIDINHRLLYPNGIAGKLNGTFPYVDSDYMAKNPFYPLYSSMKLQEAAALQNVAGFSSSSASLGNLYPSFFPLSLDPLAAAVVYSANLAAQVAAVTNQRKSSPSGGTHASGSLRRCSGSCKDPFCLGQHSNSNSSSTLDGHSPASHCSSAGCNQCAEAAPRLGNSSNAMSTSVPSTASGLFYPGCSSVPGSSFCLPPFGPLVVPGGLTPPLLDSSLGRPRSQGMICNWVQNGEYCGKRFSTSEELLLHLRGHTALPSSRDPSTPIDLVHQKQLQPLTPFNPSALPPLPFPLPSYFGSSASRSLSVSRTSPLPSYSLPLMPSHQRNSLSPGSLFSSARYHPYKSPVTPPGFGSNHQQNLLSGSFPSLAAYYSPYAVYNQRLNSATAVGPWSSSRISFVLFIISVHLRIFWLSIYFFVFAFKTIVHKWNDIA